MSNLLPTRTHRLLACILTLVLAGCGGGGGTPPPDFPLLPEDDSSEEVSPTLDTRLVDESGQTLGTIAILQTAILQIEVTDGRNRPLADSRVTFEGSNVTPEFSSAVTSTDGTAQVRVLVTPDSVPGPASITTTLSESVVDDAFFQIAPAGLVLGHFSGSQFIEGEIGLVSGTIAPSGSTTLQLAVVDEQNDLVDASVTIALSSPCANADPALAELAETATTSRGLATVRYTDSGCEGSDVVTASLEPLSGGFATGTITIAQPPPDPPTIAFSSTSTTTISLQGTGDAGRPEEALVLFTVATSDGEPVPGYPVSFSLTSSIGGISLAADQALTDAQGFAATRVISGVVSTSTQVLAEIDVGGFPFSASSGQILVTSGLPDQNSFSLSASPRNLLAGDIDGLEATVTVRLADHFNNPVPDGTPVNFATEYGAIQPNCQTVAGACNVTWSSQEPRQSLNFSDFTPTVESTNCPSFTGRGPCPVPLGKFQGGRSAIIAIAQGDESFTDSNGNGLYDPGEPFIDLPEAFLDHNEDDVFNPFVETCGATPSADCASGAEERFFDEDDDASYSIGNGIYNGSLCPSELNGIECSRDLVNVRRSVVIVGSSGDQRFAVVTADNALVSGASAITPGDYKLYISDLFNNAPPGGSSVSINSSSCPISVTSSTSRQDSAEPAAWTITFRMSESSNTEVIEGDIVFILSLPDGRSSEVRRSCVDATLDTT